MSVRRWRALALSLAGLAVLLCAPFLLSGEMLRNPGDVLEYAGPFRHFAARQLQAGQWPLWNPHLFAGAPFLASPQSALFYPPNQVFWFFPLAQAVDAFLAGHLFLNALGAALFLAAVGRRGAPAWLGGIAWGFGHFLLARAAAGHVIHISGYAWIGFILAALLPARGSAPVLAAAGALQFFSGHVQVAEHTALLSVVLAAALPGPRGARFQRGAAAALGAAALTAAQALPTLAYLSRTTRAAGFFDAATRARIALSYSLEPAALKGFLFPGAAGHPFDGTFAAGPPSVFFESYGLYMGLIPLALGAAGLSCAVRRKRWGLPAAAALFFLAALGEHGSFAALFRNVLDGQRAPARLLAGALWAWILLGASVLGASRARRGAGAALLLLTVVDLGLRARPFLRSQDPAPFWSMGRALCALRGSGPFAPRLAIGGDVPLLNKGMMSGFGSVNGFEALVPANVTAFAARTQPGAEITTTGIDVTDPFNGEFRALSARYALMTRPAPGGRLLLKVGPGFLCEDPAPLPPVRPEGGPARLISVRRPSPERLETHWESAVPFTALWAERFDPGWRSSAGPVRQHAGVIQAVDVRPDGGTAAVRWLYRPPEARAGAAVSLLAWSLFAGAGLAFLRKLV